ncbi:hypothetical protein PsYK624_136070 [Phanerochaete sordida]|uniref:Uncharacterized protein n=1 Tax=Phanerochaete sordida TaxID=48140 RepID=A0A9P3LJH6_9APHY|nr:hypothetical protein PsYK624_136070 [Phanerochaete sordida]
MPLKDALNLDDTRVADNDPERGHPIPEGYEWIAPPPKIRRDKENAADERPAKESVHREHVTGGYSQSSSRLAHYGTHRNDASRWLQPPANKTSETRLPPPYYAASVPDHDFNDASNSPAGVRMVNKPPALFDGYRQNMARTPERAPPTMRIPSLPSLPTRVRHSVPVHPTATHAPPRLSTPPYAATSSRYAAAPEKTCSSRERTPSCPPDLLRKPGIKHSRSVEEITRAPSAASEGYAPYASHMPRPLPVPDLSRTPRLEYLDGPDTEPTFGFASSEDSSIIGAIHNSAGPYHPGPLDAPLPLGFTRPGLPVPSDTGESDTQPPPSPLPTDKPSRKRKRSPDKPPRAANPFIQFLSGVRPVLADERTYALEARYIPGIAARLHHLMSDAQQARFIDCGAAHIAKRRAAGKAPRAARLTEDQDGFELVPPRLVAEALRIMARCVVKKELDPHMDETKLERGRWVRENLSLAHRYAALREEVWRKWQARDPSTKRERLLPIFEAHEKEEAAIQEDISAFIVSPYVGV